MARAPSNEPLQVFRLDRRKSTTRVMAHGFYALMGFVAMACWLGMYIYLLQTVPLLEVLPVFLTTGLPFVLLFGWGTWFFLRQVLQVLRSGRDPRFDSFEIRVDAEGISLADSAEADARLRLSWRDVQDVWTGQEFILRRPRRWLDGNPPLTAVFLRTGPLQPRGRLARAALKKEVANTACDPLRLPDFVGFSVACCKDGAHAPYELMRELHAGAQR